MPAKPKTPPVQAHCNVCGGLRTHKVLKQITKDWNQPINDHYTVWSRSEYFMLQCAGCDAVRLRHRSWFSEETDEDELPLMNEAYYPPSVYRPHPKWFHLLDKQWHITKLLEEIYRALQNDAPALGCMGLRAVIEAVMIDKVSDNGSFANNMKAFLAAGYISSVQQTALSAALELGHASIHRGHIPDEFQLGTALDITENLIHVLYVIEHQAQASVRNLPPRKS